MDVSSIVTFIVTLAGKYPFIATILMGIGFLRVLIKPLMSILHAEAAQIGSAKMEAGLEAVEQNKIYTTLLYVLDWFASVKVQPVAVVPAAVVAAAAAPAASAPVAAAPSAAPSDSSKPAA